MNAEYEDKAREMVRKAMHPKGVTVDQLTARLFLIGVDRSSGGFANKISRGEFAPNTVKLPSKPATNLGTPQFVASRK